MSGLLFQGLKVIDCASFIAAPAAATILGDFGAEVIKIEPVGGGDLYRSLSNRVGSPVSERNYGWDLDNRGKRSIALNLKDKAALSILQKLVSKADVFITNLPLPSRDRISICYEDLAKLNSRLIYASFTAYGEAGPESGKTGFDSTAYWARSGLMDLVRADGGAVPARSAPGLGDHPSAVSLFAAIVSALWWRDRSGRGCQVASSLIANGLWANAYFAQAKLFGASFPHRPPRTKALNPLSNSYLCNDNRWLILSLVNEQRQYSEFMRAVGLTELIDKFSSPAIRAEHSEEFICLLDRQFAKRSLSEWRSELDAAGITFGVVNTLDDVISDQQARHAGAIVSLADGSGETVSSPFSIGEMSKTAAQRAPRLGEHSTEVMSELGYTQREIEELRIRGAIA